MEDSTIHYPPLLRSPPPPHTKQPPQCLDIAFDCAEFIIYLREFTGNGEKETSADFDLHSGGQISSTNITTYCRSSRHT